MATVDNAVSIRVIVVDVAGRRIRNASVSIAPSTSHAGAVSLAFDDHLQAYIGSIDAAGPYLVRVAADPLEAQQRTVDGALADGPLELTFVLGEPGQDFYYVERVKTPFPASRLLAVAVTYGETRSVEEIAASLGIDFKSFDIAPVQVPEQVQRQGVQVFDVPPTALPVWDRFERQARTTPELQATGAVVRVGNESVSFLTNEVIVKLKPGASMPVLDSLGLQVVRRIPYIDNTWLLRGDGTSLEINRACNRLAEDPAVVWAEPNRYSTTVSHGDPFIVFQLHHQIIRTPGAWAITKGAGIRVAVIDEGCNVAHEDLTATFERSLNMHDLTTTVDSTSVHGTKCAGIVAASIDNGLGVAGIAGQARFWAIQRSGGLETDFSEMFVWCAGFNPVSNRPGFPGPPSPGADVFSCSWGVEGLATSGVIKGAFDQLALSGRSGRGCVVVFSVGNSNEDFTTILPWASYGGNIAVAASTIPPTLAISDERKVTSSNFGQGVDVCAPGGELTGAVNIRTLSTFPSAPSPTRNEPFSALPYALFGVTSCACAQVAGIAALILAAKPTLTAVAVKQILQDTAIKIDPGAAGVGTWVNGVSRFYGFGRVDAAAAVQRANQRVSLVDKIRLFIFMLPRKWPWPIWRILPRFRDR